MSQYDRFDPMGGHDSSNIDIDDWLRKRLPDAPKGALAACVVFFLSALVSPLVLYKADSVDGERVAAACVGAVAMLILGWICLLFFKRVWVGGGSAWWGNDLNDGKVTAGLLTAGVLFGMLGGWLLVGGNWGGIVPLLIASPGAVQGLRRGYGKSGNPQSTDGVARAGIVGLVMALRDKRRAAMLGVTTFLAVFALVLIVPMLTHMGGTMVSVLVLAVVDVVLLVAVMPSLWLRRRSSGQYVARTFRIKSFEWSWFDRGFMACVGLVMAADLFIKWFLMRPDWYLSLAEFVTAIAMLALVYEGLRRIFWGPALVGVYTEVQCCSNCGKESDRMAFRCPGCGSMFKSEGM